MVLNQIDGSTHAYRKKGFPWAQEMELRQENVEHGEIMWAGHIRHIVRVKNDNDVGENWVIPRTLILLAITPLFLALISNCLTLIKDPYFKLLFLKYKNCPWRLRILKNFLVNLRK